jgi:hypothetical protein
MAALTGLILGGLALAQTAQSVAGARQGARAARKQAGFQAGILEQQAEDTIGVGNQQAGVEEARTRGLTGAQTASYGAQGIDTTSGSASDVISNDQRVGAIEAQQIRNNAARDALGLRKQAQLVRMGGANASQGYKNQATGSLLSGAAQMYGIYNAYGRSVKQTPRAPPPSGNGRNPWDL